MTRDIGKHEETKDTYVNMKHVVVCWSNFISLWCYQ